MIINSLKIYACFVVFLLIETASFAFGTHFDGTISALKTRADEACEGVQCPANFQCKLVNDKVKCVGRVCHAKCPANFELVQCHGECQATCDDPNPICVKSLHCHNKPVCRCKQGYVIRAVDDLACIRKEQCPGYTVIESHGHKPSMKVTPATKTSEKPLSEETTTPGYSVIETQGGNNGKKSTELPDKLKTTTSKSIGTTPQPTDEAFIVVNSNGTIHHTPSISQPSPTAPLSHINNPINKTTKHPVKPTETPDSTDEPFIVVHSNETIHHTPKKVGSTKHPLKDTVKPVTTTAEPTDEPFIVVNSNESVHVPQKNLGPQKHPVKTTPTPVATSPQPTDEQFIVVHSNQTLHFTPADDSAVTTTPGYFVVESNSHNVAPKKKATVSPSKSKSTTTESPFFVVHSRSSSKKSAQPPKNDASQPSTTAGYLVVDNNQHFTGETVTSEPITTPMSVVYSVELKKQHPISKQALTKPPAPLTTTEPQFFIVHSKKTRKMFEH